MERITDPFGREALFGYDAERNLISLTDIGGYRTTVEYAAGSIMSALVNQGGRTEFYIEPSTPTLHWNQYPAPGADMGSSSRITITHPDGNKEEYYYNGVNGTGWHVAPGDYHSYDSVFGNNFSPNVPKTIYTYAATVKGARSKVASITSPNGEKKIYTYDHATARVTAVSDAAGNTARSTYTDKGQLLTRTAPNGTVTNYTYADNGIDLLEISDGLGTVTMTYNDAHQVTSSTDRAGKTTTYGYNLYGQLTTITDPLNIDTVLSYNDDHRLTQVSRNGQVIGTMTYDAVGRLRTREDATGLLLTYSYDDLDHLTTITYPDGKTETWEYGSPHSPHLVTGAVDRSGRQVSNDYDSRKNLTTVVNQERGVLTAGYDPRGNLLAFTDPNRNRTDFEYGPGNRLKKRTYADGQSESYSYYNTGLLKSVTNGRGRTTTYYYDENSNLLYIDYDDGITADVSYTYDAYDRVTAIEDGIGITSLTYDSASRVHTIDGPWDNDTITYSYDDLGRVSTVRPEGGALRSYHYDRLGRLEQVVVGSETFTYTFKGTANPLIETLTRPNGSRTTYRYNGLNQLTGVLNNKADTTSITGYIYTYNEQDLRGSETVSNGLARPAMTDGRTDARFNNVNQLLATVNPDQDFIYDEDGNMTGGYTAEGFLFTAEYDGAKRLVALEYRDNDNVLHRNEYTYRWDSFLAIIRKYAGTTLTEEVRIVRDGHLPLQDLDRNNTILREYTWGANLGGGIGGLLAMNQGGSSYFYLYDGKGNVVSVLDQNQQEVAKYRYNAFGRLMVHQGSLEQPFQFSTKRYDSNTGLVYYGYRFYNPAIERWMNRDPLGEEGGINLYGFVENDPVNWVDPLGLMGYAETIADADLRAGVDGLGGEPMLDNLSKGSSIAAGASALAGLPPLGFTALALGSTALKQALYSQHPLRDATQTAVTMPLGTSNHGFDLMFDEAINKANEFDENCKN